MADVDLGFGFVIVECLAFLRSRTGEQVSGLSVVNEESKRQELHTYCRREPHSTWKRKINKSDASCED